LKENMVSPVLNLDRENCRKGTAPHLASAKVQV
jgi:hypothetical protein